MTSRLNSSSLVVDIGQGLSLMLGLPRIEMWNTKGRPQFPKQGAFGFNTDTSSLEFFDGQYWYEASMERMTS